MSTTQILPIFKYDFEVVKGQLTDLSGNGFDITLPTSGLVQVNDPVMGSCLQFQGTDEGYITLPKLPFTGLSDMSNGLTISMWINADNFAANTTPVLIDFGGTQAITGSQATGLNDMGLRLNGMTPFYNRDYVDKTTGNTKAATLSSTETITAGKWVHLAVTVDASGCATFYKGGVAQTPQKNPDFAASAPTTPTAGNIGKPSGSTVPSFKGMIGWLAVYNGVLNGPEIEAEMVLGQSNRYFVSNRSFPMDFKLFSSDAGAESPIMFIDSAGLDQTLDFYLVNSGKKPLYIPVGSGAVDASSNYHFQLKFRPGILSEKYVTKHTTGAKAAEPLLTSSSWSTLLTKDASNNDVMSFLYIGSAVKSIDVGKEFVLQLQNINASATGGTKNTNVEFKYKGIDYGVSGVSAPQIEGYRTQNISIVNHTGDKNIPLRAEIAGMANVLTYHQANGNTAPKSDLLFHLINIGTEPLGLGTATAPDGATAFTLTVDVQPENELMDWALFAQGTGNPAVKLNVIGVVRSFQSNTISLKAPLSEAIAANTQLEIENSSGSITVTVTGNGATAGSYDIPVQLSSDASIDTGAYVLPSNGQSAWTVIPVAAPARPNQMQWTISNNSEQSFDAGKGLSFMLTGIECTLPAGSSVITIDYSNIPQHWDGSFVLPVQKSPLAFSQNLVGINTHEPEASLHIVEEVNTLPFRIQSPVAGTNALPAPDYTKSNNITDLTLIDADSQTYYDTNCYADSNGDACFNIWTITNGVVTVTPAKIVSNNKYGQTTSLNWTNIYAEPYLYCNDGNVIMLLQYDPAKNEFKIAGSTDPSGPQAAFTFSEGVLFTVAASTRYAQEYNLITYSTNQLPSTQLNKQSWGGSTEYFAAHQGYLYYTDTFYIKANKIDSDGSVGSAHEILSKADYTINTPFVFRGNYLYCVIINQSPNAVNPFQLAAIDITNPANPNPVFFGLNSNAPSTNIALYEDLLMVCTSGYLYFYDLSNSGIPQLASHFKFDGMAGIVGDLLWTSTTGSGSKLHHLKPLVKSVIGESTYITSDAIGIGTPGLPENCGLNTPFPSKTGSSGVVIGDIFKSAPAGLSISVAELSGVDPVAINYESGNSIFNIKQPDEDGQSYRVGIGTDDPKAALHVASNIIWNSGTTKFSVVDTISTDVGQYGGGASVPAKISIKADYTVMGNQFYVMSDQRIKELRPTSNLADSLATLLRLNVSDYQYIDFIGQGTGQKKGLIAQQVKEVFPQAVSAENTDFIPDIYAMASHLDWRQDTNQLKVSLEKGHDLAVGNKVRLIADQGFEDKMVIAVPDAHSFTVADWDKEVDKLFVFGKEVHDFHTVDYDQVAMLGVSAIQALHQQAKARDEKIDQLEQRLKALEWENKELRTTQTEELADMRQELLEFKAALSRQHQN
ncbi:LamG-like jellyroll fold domain-containing protein [Roseivirga pacifica]|uniref:LamG-like jellyroll fold domain-containing protein n=1 Tax=Roseivirga pacifica TaxID=1267423 RepID=UPI00209570C1|nr:LamG-like jellyroll fold domain-containing protein [Roseivirga pacifica]MCO6358759.1 hypothetical protein [Roseivirga pacifica]MCO6365605.1 hypothetical protein [Roseivirga pacifica]MCO6371665.1 hypothetical protein [Roseivirga pacifica]MCO6379043.1 hypothetical protein [Roseivirga pacifica]